MVTSLCSSFQVRDKGVGQESVKIIVISFLNFLRLTTLARRQALVVPPRLVYRLRLSIPLSSLQNKSPSVITPGSLFLC